MERINYFITGATGFLGRHLLMALNDMPNVHKYVLVRNPDVWDSFEWTKTLKNIHCIRGSLDEIGSDTLTKQLPDQIDGMFHLAAVVSHNQDQMDFIYRINVDGTLAMIKLAAHYQVRLVYVSTSGVVGCFKRSDQSADEYAPYVYKKIQHWPYYYSKYLAEIRGFDLAKSLGVEMVTLRPPVLLGPKDHRLRSIQHVNRVLTKSVSIMLAGSMHFTDVRDVATAIVKAMQLNTPKPIYHLPGTQLPLRSFYRQIANIAHQKLTLVQLPYLFAKQIATVCEWINHKTRGQLCKKFPNPILVEMAHKHWRIHSLFAETELHYSPRDPMLTLKDTIEWLKKQTYIH